MLSINICHGPITAWMPRGRTTDAQDHQPVVSGPIGLFTTCLLPSPLPLWPRHRASPHPVPAAATLASILPGACRVRSPQAELCFSSSCFFTLYQISAWLTLSSPSGHQTAPLRDLPTPCLKWRCPLLSTPHPPFPALLSPKHFLACYVVDFLMAFIVFLPK